MAARAPEGAPRGSGADGYDFSQLELVRIGSELASLVAGIQFQLSRDRRELLALRQEVTYGQAAAAGQLSAWARPFRPTLKTSPPAERSLLSVVERLRADLLTKDHMTFAAQPEHVPHVKVPHVVAPPGNHVTCCSSDIADQSQPPSRMGRTADIKNNIELVTGVKISSDQVPDVTNVSQPISFSPAEAVVCTPQQPEELHLVEKDTADAGDSSMSSESASPDANDDDEAGPDEASPDANDEEDEAGPTLTLPSLGSLGHSNGTCIPCAFLHTTGCSLGQSCRFCHICDVTDEEKRWKAKGRQSLAIDVRSQQPSTVWKPKLVPPPEAGPEPSTSASSEQCNDVNSNNPEQTEEVSSVRSKIRWEDLLSDGEVEVGNDVEISPPAKTRSKSVDHRLSSHRKLDGFPASSAPERCRGRWKQLGAADTEQGEKACLGMPLGEIKKRLGGTWTRQDENYEIDFSNWTCTKRSWAEPDGRKFKLHWNRNEDSICWGSTYQLCLSDLREHPHQVHWYNKKDSRKHFQWRRTL